MPRTSASRKYQLTFNHPAEHGFDHASIKAALMGLSGCIYWCMCDEIGEQGTPHTHLYAAFENAKEFQAIHRRFYGAHIEMARGTHRENRDYIRKEGKYRDTEKADTNLPDTFEESGDLPEEVDRRVKQSEAILAMVQEGATNAEILRKYPSAMNHLPRIDQARQTLLEERFRKRFRELQIEYIWGKTGVGKTRGVMEKYGYENVYRVTNYKNPFDGYAGEAVVLFDEFRSNLPISDMLKYLDGYPLSLPARYGDRVACFTTVYLVSNISMEKQNPRVQFEEPETWAAFLRRFQRVYELQPDGDSPFSGGPIC